MTAFRRLLAALAAAWLAACTLPAAAQSLESALSPGPLTQGHAKLEAECSNCHVRFDRAAQDRLCAACHKPVGEDLRNGTGLHGRQRPQACRSCHTDHRGREMDIARFDTTRFDHRQTDYALLGKHAPLACKACHAPGRKYREAPSTCVACHAKDDKHRGSLGRQCADCHTEQSWTQTRLDHSKTRFPLTGKHVDAECGACHKSKVYSEAPTDCLGCHRKDDRHKGRYGSQCESCHGTQKWSESRFRHERDARWPLRGRHAEVRCDSCHTGHLYRDKLDTACAACHRKDDKHQGTLGSDCAACHVERSWKAQGSFNHDSSAFPLRGAHVKAECKACHTTPRYRDAPSDCLACHKKDDKHQATLGTDCAACHTERDWKAPRFDHARTRFALREGHASPPLACKACHADARSYRNTPLTCVACHKKDDKHEGQLGERCDSCHGERGWRQTRFDHARARFALAGAHVRVECKACHTSPRYRDAPRDCIGCHRKEDKHEARFGTACDSCHNVRDWRLWRYDHERRANWALAGSHAALSCNACHTKPAPAGRAAAEVGRQCVACHRRDDVHDGAYGNRCEQCHDSTRWRNVAARPRLNPPGEPR